ncbi:hypothetical protein DER45DRAFT_552105 [Fusarium avenaceum]|nr:hypothetical protein DER45DRAFT_552105 [Fusarium avenaceum]
MDLLGRNTFDRFNFLLPLRPVASCEQAYKKLQRGLVRVMEMVPDLGCKVIPCSKHDIGCNRNIFPSLCLSSPRRP